MVLSGVMLKLGSYGLLLFLPFIVLNWLISLYFAMGLIGSVLGSLICLRQGDLKVLIAYSSVVHMGVVTLSFMRGTPIGCSSGVMIVIGHGFCSPFLFVIAY